MSGASGAVPPAQAALLSAEQTFALASLELRARAVAEGLLVGSHRSRRFGSSTEFAEYKVYSPGDELKHLDWRTYARTDRYFVRRYEEETNLDIYIVLDTSGSMAYAGGAQGAFGVSKLQYTSTLAAALIWIAARHSDAVSLSLFAADEQLYLPPRARQDHIAGLFAALDGLAPFGPTHAEDVLQTLARRIKRRSFVILLSDLLEVGEGPLASLGILRQRGSDALVLQVMDPDELAFPFDGVVRFEDLEGDREVQVDAPAIRDAYLSEMNAFLQRVRGECVRRDVRHQLVQTDVAPVVALREALWGSVGGEVSPPGAPSWAGR